MKIEVQRPFVTINSSETPSFQRFGALLGYDSRFLFVLGENSLVERYPMNSNFYMVQCNYRYVQVGATGFPENTPWIKGFLPYYEQGGKFESEVKFFKEGRV